MTFRKRKITIKTQSGEVLWNDVPALVAGAWAIHRDNDGKGLHRITHVPTGLRLLSMERYSHAREFIARIPELRLPRIADRHGNDLTGQLPTTVQRRMQKRVWTLAETITGPTGFTR